MSFIFCPHYLPSYCCREEQGEGEERNNQAVHMHASIIYFFVLGYRVDRWEKENYYNLITNLRMIVYFF